MKKFLAALLAVGLAAGASTVGAQEAPKHQMKHSMAARHTENEHAAMMELQASAIRDAQAAARLAAAKPAKRELVERDATRSRDDLQKVVKHLQDAEKTMPADMKEDVTKARGHEEEALKHAEELVTASKATPLVASAVKTHADAVVEHARLAEEVMKAHHEGMAKGAKGAKK